MSSKSTAIIKTKALAIVDLQLIDSISITNDDVGAKAANDCNITVYQHVQKQYSDSFSRLHGDIIDYFVTFLDKKQSIEF